MEILNQLSELNQEKKRSLVMNLDKLFDAIDVDETILNPFEAFQYTSAYDEFRNQYIEPLYEVSMEKGDEAFSLLASVCKELKRI